MRIGYDGKRAVANNTGLGNYSRLITEVLSERYPDNEYLLYVARDKENPRMSTLRKRGNVEIRRPDTAAGRLSGDLWRTGIPAGGMVPQLRRDGVELFHGLSGELPLNIAKAGIPSVVTVHDLIFLKHPECYKAVDRKIYDYKFRKACENATRIIAISECTRRDIEQHYGIAPEKIDVVYQGCAGQFQQPQTAERVEEVKKKYGLSRPYIVGVGTIEERKNQLLAARGLKEIGDPCPELVLVGRRTPYADKIEQYAREAGIADRVRMLDNVAFPDLPAVYAGALCSTYTSRYEGFGLPVIESLNVGTPVVVASGSCLEESGGPMTPTVDPDDVWGWVRIMRDILRNRGFRDEIAEAGREYVKRFSFEAMAEGTMNCYLRCLG